MPPSSGAQSRTRGKEKYQPMQYKDLSDQVEKLKAELAAERRKNHSLTDELFSLREERDSLRVTLAQNSSSTAQSLAQELVRLQMEYNALDTKGRRAEAEFKKCFAKWKNMKRFLQNEEAKFAEDKKQCKEEDLRQLRHDFVRKRQEKLTELYSDSEDAPETLPTASGSPTIIAVSPDVPKVSATQTPLQFQTIYSSSGLKPLTRTSSPPRPLKAEGNSDTEDESQDVYPNPIQRPLQTIAHQPPASKAIQKPRQRPISPSTPEFSVREKPKKQRHSEGFSSFGRVRHDSEDEERPRKTRRFSSPVRVPLTTIASTSPGVHPSRDAGASRGRENRLTKANGENTPLAKISNTSKQLTDYSAYKGRGRYGNAHAAVGDRTVNASYAIDPAKNGGVNFQYDAVVRVREDRRRMQGGDCESCRDYYEAIGPLPSRLQPPLWRSPPNSPDKGTRNNPCRRHGHGETSVDEHEAEISLHKQDISRHRHNWARPSTPPGFWNIGFPSTQEAENINEQAEMMHEQKRRAIEAEAENGGRYYKTR